MQAPRANAIAERWIGSVRRDLLDQMLIFNRCQLEAALAEYVVHFNAHRPHQTLNQAAPLQPLPPPALPSQLHIRRRDRLEGLLHEYSKSHDVNDQFGTHRLQLGHGKGVDEHVLPNPRVTGVEYGPDGEPVDPVDASGAGSRSISGGYPIRPKSCPIRSGVGHAEKTESPPCCWP